MNKSQRVRSIFRKAGDAKPGTVRLESPVGVRCVDNVSFFWLAIVMLPRHELTATL
jgi:hypothetical protein